MEIYNKLKQVPKDALKEIKAGRLKGKSDISPQWRYEALTNQFGACGIGWKFEITNREFVNGAGDEVAVFVDVNFYFKNGNEWSEPIPGNGGSMFIANERNGLYTSDEAIKMATTDALGTAAKMIGLAADVYRGIGSKYTNQTERQNVSDGKAWLNPGNETWAQAIEFLKGNGTIGQIKSKYKISKKNEELLMEQSI